MLINIDREGSTPVYIQIRDQIRDMIISGVLPAGFRLPPERKLADMLGVNRSTVLNAYRELKADAFIDSHVGQGTVVLSHLADISPEPERLVDPPLWRQYYSENALRTREPLLRNLMEMANREDVISFAAGIAALEMDPLDALRGSEKELLNDQGLSAFQHTPTEGSYSLRKCIAQVMESRGIFTSHEEVLVLSGSQQGIDIAGKVFIDPGDVVIVEEPSFFSAIQIFQVSGARIIGVPVDEKGMRVDILEQLLTRYKPKLIYTMPTFQNPSGIVMNMERRRQLLDLAYKYGVVILEDDAYGELRYEGKSLPPLKALDKYGYVVYLSSFTKVFFPGLRIGWMIAARPVVRQFTLAKQMADLHANSLSQWLIERFINQGLLPGHIKNIRDEYRNRRDIMLDALMKNAPKGVEWNKPEGGFYIWCRLPETINQSRLLLKASEKKVAYVPGDAFFTGGQGQNYIRLNFTFPSPAQIREGIKRLMDVIRELDEEKFDYKINEKVEIKPIV